MESGAWKMGHSCCQFQFKPMLQNWAGDPQQECGHNSNALIMGQTGTDQGASF